MTCAQSRFSSLIIAVTVTAMAFTALAFAIAPWISLPPPNREILAVATNIKPEPVESTLYLVALLFFPSALLLVSRFSWMSRLETLVGRAPRAAFFASVVLVVSFCVWAIFGDHFFYGQLNAVMFERVSWVVCAVAALVAVLWRPALESRLVELMLAAVVIATGLMFGMLGVLPATDPYIGYSDGHFEAMFFPIVRNHLGGALASQCANQYGLYPGFLAPLFKIVGLTVARYSIVMSLLAVACLLGMWSVMRREIKRVWVATGVWLSMVSFCFYAMGPYVKEVHEGRPGDPYFQYLPLRVLFPVLALWFASRDKAASRPRLHRGLAHAVLALGPLWNLEMGLVGWFAWSLFLGYRALDVFGVSWRGLAGLARHLGASLASLSLVAIAFFLYHRVLYGEPPVWGSLITYQRIFYGSGFYMLPMKVPHTWMIASALYVFGLATSLSALGKQRAPDDRHSNAIVFLLSVLGPGIFIYFQGRSHNGSLPFVTYPAWILAGLFIDRALDVHSGRIVRGMLAGILASWWCTGLAAVWDAREELGRRIALIGRPLLTPEERFFLEQVPRPQPLLFMSYRASALYLERDTAPPFCPSMAEMMTRTDRERLLAVIDHQQTIVLEDVFFSATQPESAWAPVWRKIRADFKVTAQTKTGLVRIDRVLGD